MLWLYCSSRVTLLFEYIYPWLLFLLLWSDYSYLCTFLDGFSACGLKTAEQSEKNMLLRAD